MSWLHHSAPTSSSEKGDSRDQEIRKYWRKRLFFFFPVDFLIIIRDRKTALLHMITPKADKLGNISSLLHYTGQPL